MVDITVWVELLVKIIFLILGTVLTVYIIPWIKEKRIQSLIISLVTTAEQTLKDATGSEKKTFVLDWLQKHNITYDEDKVDALLESAVYDIKNNITNNTTE